MAFTFKDRIKDTTQTTGTGSYTLDEAGLTGFQEFNVLGPAAETYYCVTNDVDWEVGIGTFNGSPATLSRDTVLDSSNAGAAVNWSAGSKNAFVTIPAEHIGTGWQLIAEGTASSVANLQFTGLSADYVSYKLFLSDVVPVTDNQDLDLAFSIDGGSTYSTTTNYWTVAYAYTDFSASSGITNTWAGSDAGHEVIRWATSDAGSSHWAEIDISHHASISVPTTVSWLQGNEDSFDTFYAIQGYGQTYAIGSPGGYQTDAMRLQFASGNISNLKYSLYGMPA